MIITAPGFETINRFFDVLPRDLQTLIYTADPTYSDIMTQEVLPELHTAVRSRRNDKARDRLMSDLELYYTLANEFYRVIHILRNSMVLRAYEYQELSSVNSSLLTQILTITVVNLMDEDTNLYTNMTKEISRTVISWVNKTREFEWRAEAEVASYIDG